MAEEKITRDEISRWFQELQDDITSQLEAADGTGKFIRDAWDRPGGGGGVSAVMTNGKIIEKGGVNFSAVWGIAPAQLLKSLQVEASDTAEFFATGISIVLHPGNPMVPIIHMNTRYFEVSGGTWWFGGGIDLTPHYIDTGDAAWFHGSLKEVCDRHHPSYYPEFKKWADDYFFLKHRNETRGVGGIFFDHLSNAPGFDRVARFAFVRDVGRAFAPIYVHFMKKNSSLPFSEQHKQWQAIRRGRYVEFNLVWDRGTRFGLDTDGRTESILMSLPPNAQWLYNFTPAAGSPEEQTQRLLRKDIDWLNVVPKVSGN
jgi:coproporphyrinogen III oxidase